MRKHCISKFSQNANLINYENLIFKAIGYQNINAYGKIIINKELENPICKGTSEYSKELEKIKCGAYLFDSFMKDNNVIIYNNILNFTEKNPFDYYENYENLKYSEFLKEEKKIFFQDDNARNYYYHSKVFINDYFEKNYIQDFKNGKNYQIKSKNIEDDLDKIQKGEILNEKSDIYFEDIDSSFSSSSSSAGYFNKLILKEITMRSYEKATFFFLVLLFFF